MFLLGARVANDEWCAVVEEDIVMACIERWSSVANGIWDKVEVVPHPCAS
jgi:hypothetical protein